jgi:hypothetical protein
MDNIDNLPIQTTQNIDTQNKDGNDDELMIPLNLLNKDHNDTNDNGEETQPVITQQKDNQPFGDPLTPNKPADTIQIFLKNINGIRNYNSWASLDNTCEHLYTLNVDIVGITEPNINWNEKIRRETKQKFQKHYQSALISTSSSTDPTKSYYQPGGTATTITNQYTGRAIKPIIDLTGMGRWSGYQLQRNTNEHLNIITVYRPIITQGIHTCYQQQVSIVKNKGINNPNPRQQLLDDLTTLITEFNNNNNKSIIMIDANEGMFTNHSKLTTFLAQTNLTSLIQHTQHQPVTHSRGTQCIDYIFGTQTILEHIHQSGMTSFYEHPWPFTDHRGLFIDVHFLGLFGASTHSLLPKQPKRITSLSNTVVQKYINKLEQFNELPQLLNELNAIDVIQQWTQQEHTILEEIDTKFTNLLLQAESECAIPTQHPWSPELDQ